MLKLWWTDTGNEAADLKPHNSRVTTLAFSADGSRLVSADRDGWTYVWAVPDRDTRAGASPLKPLASFNHGGQPVSVARFLDNQRIVTGTGDLAPQRWHADVDLRNAREIPSRFTRFDLAGSGEPKSLELHSIAREFSGRESPLGTRRRGGQPSPWRWPGLCRHGRSPARVLRHQHV